MEQILCIVSEISDDVAKTRSLIENFHRQDNAYEEKVTAFVELYENYCKKNLDVLSTLVGLKIPTIRRYLRLSQLPREILCHVDTIDGEKRLTLQNADDLLGIDGEKATILVKKVLENNLSNKQIKNTIDAFKKNDDINQIDNIINNSIIQADEEKDLIATTCPWFYNPDDPKQKPVLIPHDYMKQMFQFYLELNKSNQIK